MTSLESIVLPLEQSRALVEHGIVLETTALVWIAEGQLDDEDNEPTIFPRVDALDDEGGPMWDFIPAPVLSELLDAIREKVGDESWCELFWGKKSHLEVLKTNTDSDDDLLGEGEAPTDLLAAAALLMEVSK
jgi:hypothetical protein